MGRALRIRLPNLTFHVVQRGHNRAPTFRRTQDYLEYLSLVRIGGQRFETRIHAYVLMTNHVHLLLTSNLPDGVSLLLQYVSGQYAARFNKRHERRGALWEGRFHASPIDSDRYCLACYRYIELNPVRAGIVGTPGAYRWSSYGANSTAAGSPLIAPHPSFLTLAQTPIQRAARYRDLVREALPGETLDTIREGLRTGLPVGDAAFKRNIERAVQRTLAKRKPGRPRKNAQDLLTVEWLDDEKKRV